MKTYNATLKTLTYNPKIEVSFDFDPKDIDHIVRIADHSFPSLEVIDNETGEIVVIRYNSLDRPAMVTNGDAIELLKKYIIKPEVQ